MDPFTEKLLERTRARRENLQKKMAERPNAANRQMVKRPREPLGETNSVVSQSAIEQVPQVSTKPSPSKRKCSGENLQPPAGEENQEPTETHPVVPLLPNPPTDKKPPLGPASGRPSSSSQEKAPLQPTVQPEPLTTAPSSSHDIQMEPVTHTAEEPKSLAAGMKSRLQKLAEYRKCWDGDGSSEAAENCTPLPVLRREAEAGPPAVSAVSSGTPVGRRGRLANLAATIGSWEDDLSHANIPKENTKEKATAPPARFHVKETPVASSSKQTVPVSSQAAGNESASRCSQAASNFVTSGKVVPPSPQKVNVSASNPSFQSSATSQASTIQGKALSSVPQKTGSALSSSSSSSVSESPLKIKTPSKSPNIACSPQKPVLSAKPTTALAQAPAIKSFLERFEERCQDRTNQASPASVALQAKTPSGTPSVTPNTRLMQERLKATQAANTTTAELTQRQKLERESELALIRSRFQKGNNMWRENNAKPQDLKTSHESKVGREASDLQKTKEQGDGPAESDLASHESNEESVAPPEEGVAPPSKTAAEGSVTSPPPLTSIPLKKVALNPKSCTAETSEDSRGKEVVTETEMSVDQSINSAVINELFEGVLEQSDDASEDEEDVLNISSMSILTPLAETVAAVVKSPDRGMMTSTPANSFIVKDSPDDVSRPSRFQRPHAIQGSSCSSVEASDDNLRLPYSIDAYRSTRVKDTERPSVKQVIVRKEDVSQRAEETRGSTAFSIKQKMKILKNEMNLQQTVIHQASQALNCCTDEEHGKGSQVEAEAERLLLVATEKREALRAELDRLSGHLTAQDKRPAAQEPAATCASKGSITVQELRLPLKADFACSSANRPEATKHSFFIILRAGAVNTVATPLASTHSGLSGDTLTFSTKFTVSDVSSDFEIDVEVYCLVQKRELCSDKKKKANKSKAITPKRFLAITKSAQTPVVASPGGPNAVRTSHFVLVGSHKLNLSSIGKNKFPLEKVPFLCPLEGHVFLKLQCEVGSKVEERGFLTMFEDVSGFGAWHRRWCVLSGYYISYWTYPDDEKRKNPIGRINLASCTSKAVEPANREFCARPNTFELITMRPQREDDKETLVSQCKNTMCVTKNWLSADTKDERNLWMKKLNQIVMDLRMWQPDACSRPQ